MISYLNSICDFFFIFRYPSYVLTYIKAVLQLHVETAYLVEGSQMFAVLINFSKA